MSGTKDCLLGWIGIPAPADERKTILTRMAGRPARSDDGTLRVVCQSDDFLLATTGKTKAFNDEALAVALVGDVRWDAESAPAGIAQERGMAQAIADGYRESGFRVLETLKGPFAVTVLDKRTGQGLFAVDRMGINSVAYATVGKGVVFGSTVNGVAAHPRVNTEVDGQSIFDYVYFHMIPSPETIYKGVAKLPPAHYVIRKPSGTHTGSYWCPDFSETSNASTAEQAEQLTHLLEQAVVHCEPDHRTGAFLSGGLDSSTVTGFLSKVCPPARTYSIGFSANGYDETHYARIAAKHFGAEPHEYYVSPQDVAEILANIAQAYDEPFGNSSVIPTYYCAKLAAEDGIRKLLAGDGGDELFAGNERYGTQKLFEIYARVPRPLRESVVEPLVFGFPGGERNFLVRKARRYIEQAKIPLPDRLQSYNILQTTPLDEIFEPDFLQSIDAEHPLHVQRQRYEAPAPASVLDRLLFLDWKQTLADNDLRKVNHMCDLADIEVRYPMLDDDLVEFSAQVPAPVKLKGFRLRHFYRRALRGFLPSAVLEKEKHGFGLPFGVWLRTSPVLQEIARDSIQGLKTRQFLRADHLDRLLRAHSEDHAAFYGESIWVLMMLELWLRAHSEQ